MYQIRWRRHGSCSFAMQLLVEGGSLASSCCIIQLLLSFFGFGCSGLVKILAPFRTLLVASSVIHAVYLHTSCDSCGVGRGSKYVASTVLLVLIVSPFFVDAALGSADRVGTGRKIRVKVDGMGCRACALSVKMALERVPAVSDCEYEASTGCFTCRNAKEDHQVDVLVKDSIEALGFVVASIVGATDSHSAKASDLPWENTDRANND
jgi:copper chaperone CopZ